ncbi:MAG: FeoB-associated Cys-rich membrane protein [Planctomycetes bacterium]|nr:FeoB-associated Cys-rich membrane protein [Planctomycetota bacterium]
MAGQDLIALLLAAGALGFVVRYLRRSMKHDGGCGCSAGSSCASNPRGRTEGRALRKVPLVTLGQEPAATAPSAAAPVRPPGESEAGGPLQSIRR